MPSIERGMRPLMHPSEQEGFTVREWRLLQRVFSDLEGKPVEEGRSLFRFDGRRLPVSQLDLLHAVFPRRTAAALSELVAQPERLADAFISLAGSASAPARQRIWQAVSALPFPAAEKRRIVAAFRSDAGGAETSGAGERAEGEAAFAWSPQLALLPFAHLPRLETSLETGREEGAEIPPAVIRFLDADGREARELRHALAPEETVAVARYLQALLKQWQEPAVRARAEAAYRAARGLPDDAALPTEEVRDAWIRRRSALRLRRFAAELVPEAAGHEPDVRFAQWRKTMPQAWRRTISDPAHLEEFFAERMPEAEARGPSSEPPMLALGAVDPFLHAERFVWEEDAPPDETGVRRYPTAERAKSEVFMNELQRAYIAITHATKSGQWEAAVDAYLKYLEYWPQHLEHRLGVSAVVGLARAGKIDRLPRRVLSLASGPHEELRGWESVSRRESGVPIPTVVSFDASTEMLDGSYEKLSDAAKQHAVDLIGDMRDVAKLPESEEEADFDLLECSSFDNLRTDAEISRMVADALPLVRAGGAIRFAVADPFSSAFLSVLEAHGVEVELRNVRPRMPPDLRAEIAGAHGAPMADRVAYKLGRHVVLLAVLLRPIDGAALRRDLEGIAVFAPRPKRTAAAVKRELAAAERGEGDAEEMAEGIFATVATNPAFFLKKGVTPSQLRFAIDRMPPPASPAAAAALWHAYRAPGLEAHAEAVARRLAADRNTPLPLLVLIAGHADAAVARLGIEALAAQVSTRLADLFNAALPDGRKRDVFAAAAWDGPATEALAAFVARQQEAAELPHWLALIPSHVRVPVPELLCLRPELKGWCEAQGAADPIRKMGETRFREALAAPRNAAVREALWQEALRRYPDDEAILPAFEALAAVGTDPGAQLILTRERMRLRSCVAAAVGSDAARRRNRGIALALATWSPVPEELLHGAEDAFLEHVGRDFFDEVAKARAGAEKRSGTLLAPLVPLLHQKIDRAVEVGVSEAHLLSHFERRLTHAAQAQPRGNGRTLFEGLAASLSERLRPFRQAELERQRALAEAEAEARAERARQAVLERQRAERRDAWSVAAARLGIDIPEGVDIDAETKRRIVSSPQLHRVFRFPDASLPGREAIAELAAMAEEIVDPEALAELAVGALPDAVAVRRFVERLDRVRTSDRDAGLWRTVCARLGLEAMGAFLPFVHDPEFRPMLALALDLRDAPEDVGLVPDAELANLVREIPAVLAIPGLAKDLRRSERGDVLWAERRRPESWEAIPLQERVDVFWDQWKNQGGLSEATRSAWRGFSAAEKREMFRQHPESCWRAFQDLVVGDSFWGDEWLESDLARHFDERWPLLDEASRAFLVTQDVVPQPALDRALEAHDPIFYRDEVVEHLADKRSAWFVDRYLDLPGRVQDAYASAVQDYLIDDIAYDPEAARHIEMLNEYGLNSIPIEGVDDALARDGTLAGYSVWISASRIFIPLRFAELYSRRGIPLERLALSLRMGNRGDVVGGFVMRRPQKSTS